jgi:hypothetical protein
VTYDPEVRKRWLDALRSGKYQQAKTVLRTENDRYCCLGVLCEIVDPEGWTPGRVFNADAGVGEPNIPCLAYGGTEVFGVACNYTQMPPEKVLARAGVTYRFAEILAEHNDDGESFADIARRIEALAPGQEPERED